VLRWLKRPDLMVAAVLGGGATAAVASGEETAASGAREGQLARGGVEEVVPGRQETGDSRGTRAEAVCPSSEESVSRPELRILKTSPRGHEMEQTAEELEIHDPDFESDARFESDDGETFRCRVARSLWPRQLSQELRIQEEVVGLSAHSAHSSHYSHSAHSSTGGELNERERSTADSPRLADDPVVLRLAYEARDDARDDARDASEEAVVVGGRVLGAAPIGGPSGGPSRGDRRRRSSSFDGRDGPSRKARGFDGGVFNGVVAPFRENERTEKKKKKRPDCSGRASVYSYCASGRRDASRSSRGSSGSSRDASRDVSSCSSRDVSSSSECDRRGSSSFEAAGFAPGVSERGVGEGGERGESHSGNAGRAGVARGSHGVVSDRASRRPPLSARCSAPRDPAGAAGSAGVPQARRPRGGAPRLGNACGARGAQPSEEDARERVVSARRVRKPSRSFDGAASRTDWVGVQEDRHSSCREVPEFSHS